MLRISCSSLWSCFIICLLTTTNIVTVQQSQAAIHPAKDTFMLRLTTRQQREFSASSPLFISLQTQILIDIRGGALSPSSSTSSKTTETPSSSSLSSSSTTIDKIRHRLSSLFGRNHETPVEDSSLLSSLSNSSGGMFMASDVRHHHHFNPLQMYLTCMTIVLIWVATGTLFYSYCNDWPLPQSFFYAVDAGMSIGFCTDVAETKLTSKAFTIVFILLGASVIGGALALFIQDAVEGLSTTPSTKEYKVLLEQSVFQKADVDQTGHLCRKEFETLIQSTYEDISEEDMEQLWNKFDRLQDGVIHFEEFVGTYRRIDRLVQSIQQQQKSSLKRAIGQVKVWFETLWEVENRIYVVFLLWITTGILWGMLHEHWDPITATHFAVSALATGGLTAPQVNQVDGILPPSPAIFCGVYCLFGIPLFALTLGNFARVLVSDHVAAIEASALSRPLSRAELELARHLTMISSQDNLVHFSDFCLLQLLRQGKLSVDAVRVLKQNFDWLDQDQSGTLTLEQAMSAYPPTKRISKESIYNVK